MEKNKKINKKIKKYGDAYNLFNIDRTLLNAFNEEYSQNLELATILKYKYQPEDIQDIENNIVDGITNEINRFKENGYTEEEVRNYINYSYIQKRLEDIQYLNAIINKILQHVDRMIDMEYNS